MSHFCTMFDNISQAIPKLTKWIEVKSLYLKYIKYIFIKFKIYELSNILTVIGNKEVENEESNSSINVITIDIFIKLVYYVPASQTKITVIQVHILFFFLEL